MQGEIVALLSGREPFFWVAVTVGGIGPDRMPTVF